MDHTFLDCLLVTVLAPQTHEPQKKPRQPKAKYKPKRVGTAVVELQVPILFRFPNLNSHKLSCIRHTRTMTMMGELLAANSGITWTLPWLTVSPLNAHSSWLRNSAGTSSSSSSSAF